MSPKIVLATGGIGSGVVFALAGDATLGREESRAARLLPARDFCKLHIVAHTLRSLAPDDVRVVPVGGVGDDPSGHELRAMIADHGMALDDITVFPHAPTLFATAFTYPNGDGGNITAVDSASDAVGVEQIRAAFQRLDGPPDVVVALPEVPLPTRAELLAHAPPGALRIASFVRGELIGDDVPRVLTNVDLLVMNLDEARALAATDEAEPAAAARAVRSALGDSGIRFIVTAGAAGSWTWDGDSMSHARADATEVVGTAGAGDAYLAGVIAALCADAHLADAARFGAIVGSLAVEAPDAIRFDLNTELAVDRARRQGVGRPLLDRLAR